MGSPSQPLKLFERRTLTQGETALAQSIFEDEVDWARVTIVQAPRLGFGAMAPFGKTIIFSRWRAVRDFSGEGRATCGWLVHEMAHIWQAARGVNLPLAKLGALGKGAYRYKPRSGAALQNYNIERQAEIARHLYLARTGKPEAGAPPREWLEEIWAKR